MREYRPLVSSPVTTPYQSPRRDLDDQLAFPIEVPLCEPRRSGACVTQGATAVLPHTPKQMSITWKVTPLVMTDQGLETPQCRDCRMAMNVHQPDEDRPEHLLGTCASCGAWYLIE